MTQESNETKRQAIKAQKALEKDNALAGILDPEARTYTFQKEISVAGVRREGTFTVKYMGVAARLRVGTLRAKLLDGAPSASVDGLTDDIAFMMAYLNTAIVKAPKWWNFDELDDIEDLKAMYQEVYDFVQHFRVHNESSTNAGASTDAIGEEDVED